MNNSQTNNHTGLILNFLLAENLIREADRTTITPLSGDGSSRLFFDITTEKSSYFGILPAADDSAKGMAEAVAAYKIGCHLKKRGIPVPVIHGFDPGSGFILFENLGRTLLYDFLEEKRQKPDGSFDQETIDLYKEIVESLLYMQISGSVSFKRNWCWDTERYDKKLMLAKESGYFMESFCRDFLEMTKFPDGLDDEFKLLAGRAARQPAVYFLHRDFQSRNLMLAQGEVKIIDFQGARLGPLGYDLASLLIDPYAGLPEELQDELLEYYLEHLCKYGLDDRAFLRGYPYLALQRNLQVLGAFAFLGYVKQKEFFRQFIRPAAASLHLRLQGKEAGDFPRLLELSGMILEILEQKKYLLSSSVD